MAASKGTDDPIRAQLDDPRLIRFYEYWQSKTKQGRLPARADFDPIEIPDLLPWIYLIDVVNEVGRRRMRCRLVGTSIVQRTGRDMTGRYFDDGMFTPATLEAVTAAFNEVIDSGTPAVFVSRPDIRLTDQLEHAPYKRVLCPLATDGKTVDLLAGLMAFEE